MTIARNLGPMALACTLSCCVSAAGGAEKTLISHCDYYLSDRSISEILKSTERGYVLHLTDSSAVNYDPGTPYILKFSGYSLFSSETDVSLSLRVAVMEDQSAINERRNLHNSVSFLMDYVRRPPAYGFFGSDRSNCNIIPVVQPGIDYWVLFDGGRISLFEPLGGASRLRKWINYYAESRYGKKNY